MSWPSPDTRQVAGLGQKARPKPQWYVLGQPIKSDHFRPILIALVNILITQNTIKPSIPVAFAEEFFESSMITTKDRTKYLLGAGGR